MASYWDPLADELPPEVIDAMASACAEATHHGGGREGESALMAGVRELLRHVTPKAEVAGEIDKYMRASRRQLEEHQAEIRGITENGNRIRADEHNALARVWQLYMGTHGRKTLSREAVHRALAPGEYEGEALL